MGLARAQWVLHGAIPGPGPSFCLAWWAPYPANLCPLRHCPNAPPSRSHPCGAPSACEVPFPAQPSQAPVPLRPGAESRLVYMRIPGLVTILASMGRQMGTMM